MIDSLVGGLQAVKEERYEVVGGSECVQSGRRVCPCLSLTPPLLCSLALWFLPHLTATLWPP